MKKTLIAITALLLLASCGDDSPTDAPATGSATNVASLESLILEAEEHLIRQERTDPSIKVIVTRNVSEQAE